MLAGHVSIILEHGERGKDCQILSQSSFYIIMAESKRLSEEEVERLRASLRTFLNNVVNKYGAGPGILRKVWNEVLEERFGPLHKREEKRERS